MYADTPSPAQIGNAEILRSITPTPPPKRKSTSQIDEETTLIEGIHKKSQSVDLSLAGLLESFPPSTPLWIDNLTLFHLYGSILNIDTPNDFDKFVSVEMKRAKKLHENGIPGVIMYGKDKRWMYMAPSSPKISLPEVKLFTNKILNYFKNNKDHLRTMLLSPNNILYENETSEFVSNIMSDRNNKFSSLINHIMKDKTHSPRVLIVRCIKLLLAGGAISFKDIGIENGIQNLKLPDITIGEGIHPAKAQKSSNTDSPRAPTPPTTPKYTIPLCYTEKNLFSLSTILFLEVFLQNREKVPAQQGDVANVDYANEVLLALHPIWLEFESGNIEYPKLGLRTIKGCIPTEDLIGLINCTSSDYNQGRFNTVKLRKIIHDYLSNLKLNEIIDLGNLPEGTSLTNIVIEMNHKNNHALDNDKDDDNGKSNFAVSWRAGDYGPGKEKISMGGKIMFRHLLYTCNLARRKIRTILALFHNLLLDAIPTLDDLVSTKTVIGGIKQLDDIDRLALEKKLKNYGDALAGAWMFLLFDDTEINKVNRHVVHISYFDRDRDAPVLTFLSIGSTKSKGDDSLSKTDLEKIEQFRIPKEMMKGTVSDHHAITESIRLNGLLNKSSIWMTVGDGMHKVSLIGKEISINAFGINKFDEKDTVTKHHQQVLHDLVFAYGKSFGSNVAIANDYMDNEVGIWSVSVKKPTFNRWETIGRCSRHFVHLLKAKNSKNKCIDSLFFEYLKDSTPDTSVNLKKVWGRLQVAVQDYRLIAGLTYEMEYHEVYEYYAFAFLRNVSRQGFGPGFRSMDIAEMYEYRWVQDFWSIIKKQNFDGWKDLFPLTVAAAEKIPQDDKRSMFFGSLKNGFREGYNKFEELYKYLNQPLYTFMFVFCRGRSGSCVRAMTTKLRDLHTSSGGTGGAKFTGVPPVETTGDCAQHDSRFTKVFSTVEDVRVLDAVFKELGWYEEDLLSDFVTLGSNKATERNDDTLTLNFVEGGGECIALYERCKVTVGVMPTVSLVSEFSFGVLKYLLHGKTVLECSIDEVMAYLQNTVHYFRHSRMEDLRDEKDLENFDPNITAEQDIEDVRQARSLEAQYDETKLTSKKSMQADRKKAVTKKQQDIVAEGKETYSKRHVPSEAENTFRIQNQLSTSLVHEIQSQMINDTSWSELLNAVLFGVQLSSFQLDRSSMFFGRSDLINAKDCIELLKSKPINTFIEISKKRVRWRYSDILDNPGYYDKDEGCWQSKLLWKDMSSPNQGRRIVPQIIPGEGPTRTTEWTVAKDAGGSIVLSGWVPNKETYVMLKKTKKDQVVERKEKSWNQVSFLWNLKFWLSLFMPPFTAPKINAADDEEKKKPKPYIHIPCKGLVAAFVLGDPPAPDADATVVSNYRQNLRAYHILLQYLLWGTKDLFQPPVYTVTDKTTKVDSYDEVSDKIFKEVIRRFGKGRVRDFRDRVGGEEKRR